MKNNIKYSIFLFVASFLSVFLGFKMDVYADWNEDNAILLKYLYVNEDTSYLSEDFNKLWNEYVCWDKENERTNYVPVAEYVCSVFELDSDVENDLRYKALKTQSEIASKTTCNNGNNCFPLSADANEDEFEQIKNFYCGYGYTELLSCANINESELAGQRCLAYKLYFKTLFNNTRDTFQNSINNSSTSNGSISGNSTPGGSISSGTTSGSSTSNSCIGLKNTVIDRSSYNFTSSSNYLCKYIEDSGYVHAYYNFICPTSYTKCSKDLIFNSDAIASTDSERCYKIIEFGRDYSNYDYNNAASIAFASSKVQEVFYDEYYEFACNCDSDECKNMYKKKYYDSFKSYEGWDADYSDFRTSNSKVDFTSYCNSSPSDSFCLFLRVYLIKDNLNTNSCNKMNVGDSSYCKTNVPNLDVYAKYVDPIGSGGKSSSNKFKDWYQEPGNITTQECNKLFGNVEEEGSIANLVNYILGYVRIIVPVLVIVLCSIDLFKAVISGDEDAMKKAQKHFVKRLLFGLAVFLAPSLINILMWAVEKGLNINNSCNIPLKL